MRFFDIIIIVLITSLLSAQEAFVIDVGYFKTIDFEDTSQYKYISIDTNRIWYITKPEKQILNSANSGDYAIISDTNEFYPERINSSFQLNLNYEHGCDVYYISFVHKYDFDKNNDGGIIETSYDNGYTWKNIIYDSIIVNYLINVSGLYSINDTIYSFENQPGFTGLQQEFSIVDIEFFSYGIEENNIDTMLLRFTIASDSIEANNEGWMLDDFRFAAGLVNIDHISIQNNIRIIPNPADNIVSILSNKIGIQKIELFTLSGVKILEMPDKDTIDISGLKRGVYLIRVNDFYLKKLVIK